MADMNNLDPQVMAALLQQWQLGNPTASVTNGQYGIQPVYGWEGGDGGGQTITPNFFANAPDSADGKRQLDQWDQAGNYIGRGTDTNSWTAKDWLMAIGALAGGAWAGGAFGGGAAAGTGGAGVATADQLGMMGLGTQGMGGAAATGAAGGGGALGLEGMFGAGAGTGAGLDGAATLGTAGGVTEGGGALGLDGLFSGVTGAGSGLDGAATLAGPYYATNPATNPSWLDGLGVKGSTLGKVAGAVLGAASGKDQQQSSNQTRDPWGPAQPLLKDLIGQGQDLAKQPAVSQGMNTAYANQAGLLDAINKQAPGWLAGMQSAANGSQAYDPSNPRGRKAAGGQTGLMWSPQAINMLGKG